MAGAEVVAAVEHHVGGGHQRVEPLSVGTLLQADDAYLRVDGSDGLRRRPHLGLADTRQVVGDLPLQVGQVHGVVVDQRDRAHAGRAQVQRHRRAQPTCADHQGVGFEQPLLAFDAEFVEQDVARVAQQLLVAQAVVRGVVH